MAIKYVTVNENSSIFHDQTTGITVLKGQVKKLNEYQQNSRRIQNALSSGHLVVVTDPEKLPKEGEDMKKLNEAEKVDILKNKFESMYKAGLGTQKFVQNFSLEELKEIASEYDIEAEEKDTKATLVEAILKELSTSNSK